VGSEVVACDVEFSIFQAGGGAAAKRPRSFHEAAVPVRGRFFFFLKGVRGRFRSTGRPATHWGGSFFLVPNCPRVDRGRLYLNARFK
jgi:hypothetical protein